METILLWISTCLIISARPYPPLWVIGRRYSEADPYAQQVFALAKQHTPTLRYEGAVADRATLAAVYRAARGFVLLSVMETRSLAAEEAAACKCPLLLSDLPWARATFDASAPVLSRHPFDQPDRGLFARLL